MIFNYIIRTNINIIIIITTQLQEKKLMQSHYHDNYIIRIIIITFTQIRNKNNIDTITLYN
jgi:hypothetical protein